MHNTSDLYKQILADETHEKEVKAIIAGVEYLHDRLISVSTESCLLSTNGPGIGCAVSRQIDMEFYPDGAIPDAARVELYVRLSSASLGVSEWIPQGVFYIDTREPDNDCGTLKIHGYDCLTAYAYDLYIPEEGGETGEWPRTMRSIAEDIAVLLNTTLDDRCVFNDDLLMDYPANYSMWELLQYIAAAHGGNWTVTDDGKLRLVVLEDAVEQTVVGILASDASIPDKLAPVSAVRLWLDSEHYYESGDATGLVIEADCPWATQAMADYVIGKISGFAYQPFVVSDAFADPAAEIGDGVSVCGITSIIAKSDRFFDGLCLSKISAPYNEELRHELPSKVQRETDRKLSGKLTLGDYYYGTSISRLKGLHIQKTNGEDVAGEVLLNSDVFTMRALIDGVMQDCIYFDTAEGRYRLSGSVIIDGGLTVNALYAEQGDIAQLTVDWLDTSHKIKRYLEKDTSDDNHIVVHEQRIQFSTASVVLDDSGEPMTEQLTNRYGTPLYWMRDIADANIVDGYPYIDGAQVLTTTDETEWPVIVYQYETFVKREITFDDTDTKVPIDTYGAGYGNDDPERGKGFIQKTTNSFDLWLLNSNGEKIGVFLGDKYSDITGLRKTTELDFSGWSNGSFSEKVDGKEESINYGVTFDSDGRPVKITDGDGHETTIKW